MTVRSFLVLLVLIAFFSFHERAHAFGQKRARPSQPVPPPGATLEHGELRLRVLSYNVHGLTVPGIDPARFGEIGRILRARRARGTAPQIVAIQEGFHADIVDLINEAGYPYRKDGPGPAWPRIGSGLILLSEYPITEARAMVFDFDNTAGFDWNARKGILYTHVRLPGLAAGLDVLDTHLQADYDDFTASLDETISARRRQLKELGAYFRRVTRPDGPVIFAGDFNTNPRIGDYYDLIGQTLLADAAESCVAPGACQTNVDAFADLSASLDHQLIRSGGGVRVEPISYEKTFREPVGGRLLSDHDGLEVVYKVSW